MGINFKEHYKSNNVSYKRFSRDLTRVATTPVETTNKLRSDNINFLKSLGYKVLIK